jgi:hypothetical protein
MSDQPLRPEHKARLRQIGRDRMSTDAWDIVTSLLAELDGLSKCSDGHTHVLYAIESGNWIEEVGCERCLLKIAGQKGDENA